MLGKGGRNIDIKVDIAAHGAFDVGVGTVPFR